MRTRICSIFIIILNILSPFNAQITFANDNDFYTKPMIAVSDYHTVLLKSDGTVWSWGRNQQGQLGIGNYINQNKPTKINIDNVKQIKAGHNFTCALKNDGSVYYWGNAFYMPKMGLEATTTPKKMDGIDDVKQIEVGTYHILYLKNDGTVWTQGWNYYGQLGNGSNSDKFYTFNKLNMNDVKELCDITNSTCSALIKESGELFACGKNYGNTMSLIQDNNCKFASFSLAHTVLINGYNILETWGVNEYGQLGKGKTDINYSNEKNGVLYDVLTAATSSYFTVAITQNGDVYTWGRNNFGQLGNGTYDDKYFPTKISINADNSITSVTRSSIVQNRYYGATTYKNFDAGDVYDSANNFNDACLNYITAVHGVAARDTGIDIKKAAEKLKAVDSNSNEKWLTYISLPDKAVDAAYMAYADYLQSIVNKGVSLGKINLNNDTISIEARIINQIRYNFTISSFTYNYNGFNISLSVTGYGNTSFGTMTLKKGNSSYLVTVCTKPTETANAISSYINELEEITDDVLRQGIRALVSELADITGFYDFEKEIIEERVKNYTGKLREHGYGNVLTNIKKCYDGYDIIKDVIRWNDAKHITNELDNAEKLYKKISLLSYTDADVDNLIISQALNALETAQKNLADTLYNYIYHSTGSAPNKPGFFDKAASWWSSLWQCPVDFTVYDESGAEIGYVRSGIVYHTDDIYIETSGDVKKLYIPQGMNVSIEMNGTDEGTFNYVVEEFSDGEPTGRLNYYDIPLTKESKYIQSLNTTNLTSEVDAIPITSDDITINANEYLSADDMEAYVVVTSECEGDGVVIGSGNYAKGDSVKLTAIASVENYKFVGWYVNDELVSTDAIYQFTALENVTVKAVFEEQYIVDDNYSITITDEYEENLQVSVCKNDSYTNDIVITSSLESYSDNMKLYCNAYSQGNETIIDNQLLTALYDGKYSYIAENIDFSYCYRIELLNENGFVLANLIRNIDDTYIYIANDIVNSIFISGNFVSADVELYNKLDENKDVWCVIATYGNDNSLIGISSTDITVNANSSAEFNLTVENDIKPHYIKIFVWDGADTTIPITKSITIDNSDE